MSESALDILMARIASHANMEAIIWHDRPHTYYWLLQEVEQCQHWLADHSIGGGMVVLLEADYSPSTIAMLLALLQNRAIVVPFAQGLPALKNDYLRISQAEAVVSIGDQQQPIFINLETRAVHPLYEKLRSLHHPGLVLFSSGTSGAIKGVVHDAFNLFDKVDRIIPRFQRTLAFLILDHLGGLDTLIYSLANIGCLVVPEERTPDGILACIEKYKVQLLPTSPSFLSLVLLSGAYQRHSLHSLRKISYGSESMPQRLLNRLHELFPHIKMVQTYASSELGVLRSASESSNSLWMHIGGIDFETRVVDHILQVRSSKMMLGYLNAPSVVTEDGWFITGDVVEQDGGYLRIKGRTSDTINVGGEKVNPLEVEDVIGELEEVGDVLVFGEANAILGQIVCARVVLVKQDLSDQAINRIRRHCLARMPKHKVPMRIDIVEGSLSGERHKRKR